MPGGSSVRSLKPRSLKVARNEIDKYSRLAQSHASLPTTTRALVSTLRTRKLYCPRQKNWPSSFIEQKLNLAAPRWARVNEEEEIPGPRRKETKDVYATSESTYNRVSKVRESKMPGSSSIRSLLRRPLKAVKNEID